jgi:hypothetical protein
VNAEARSRRRGRWVGVAGASRRPQSGGMDFIQ